MIFQSGDQIDQGKYLIKSPLGSGGMGEVYLAYQSSVEREVAFIALDPLASLQPASLDIRQYAKITGHLRPLGLLPSKAGGNVICVRSRTLCSLASPAPRDRSEVG